MRAGALLKAGCDTVRSEKVSGSSGAGRQELETLLTFVRPGDTLMVTRIDRLARSVGDLQDIVRTLKAKGVSLKATDQPIDTSSETVSSSPASLTSPKLRSNSSV